ncbi:hypothetical protein C8A03DRAFT_45220 [Achaetomium macrosporum]|uniref:Uncharacterized protein n=1 Tax=Achaetomium macrosporum TaxID=79813 RepID=A0AAN7C7F7_9PEZI|nr:hypothetical protein C8A03DRAFT_45220 [Achaetomium macrosporum]
MATPLGLTSSNWSYYTIPVAWALCMVPNTYAGVKAGKNFDNTNPRKTEENCAKDASLDKVTLRRISRARAATANGFETLGLYAAAVVAGNAARLPAEQMNRLTLAYIVSRAVYNYVYIVLQDNRRMATVRSLVWVSGIGIIMSLFVLAGQTLS